MRGAALAVMLVAFVVAQPARAQAPPTNQDLQAALHLRPDQQAAWRAYDQATAPTTEEAQQDRHVAERLRSLPTPARLDLMLQQLDAERAALARQAEAIKRLYAVLSAEQRRAFDDLTLPSADSR